MSTRDMSQSIMRRKPIYDIEEENKHSGLLKSLGLWQLTAIGVGGIMSGPDAVAKLDAGASLVQIYSGFIYRGPSLISEAAAAIASHSKP